MRRPGGHACRTRYLDGLALRLGTVLKQGCGAAVDAKSKQPLCLIACVALPAALIFVSISGLIPYSRESIPWQIP